MDMTVKITFRGGGGSVLGFSAKDIRMIEDLHFFLTQVYYVKCRIDKQIGVRYGEFTATIVATPCIDGMSDFLRHAKNSRRWKNARKANKELPF